MKKKRRYLILSLILTLYFSVSLTAFDPISIGLELIGGQIPKPVYSIWDGLEKVKMANEVDNLSIANDALVESEKQSRYQLDSAKIISIMMGNTSLVDVIDRKVAGLEGMGLDDWLEVSYTDIINELESILGLIVTKKTTAEPTPEEQKRIEDLLAITAGLRSTDGTILNTADKTIMKKKIEDDYLVRLAAETSQYGAKEGELIEHNVSNSTPIFVEEKQKQLKTLEEKLKEAEETQENSLVKQIKYNNQLQILNAQINLKILNALNLQNEASFVDLINTREERLRKSLGEGNE